MKGFMKHVAADRLSGDRPSTVRAFIAAGAIGAVAAGVTYRLLRQ
jgi:hypothetical protein